MNEENTQSPESAELAEKKRPNIALTPVESNQVKAIGYDEATKTLAVTFTRGAGAIYHYPDVSKETFDAFMGAESIGKFFGQHIKPLAFEKFARGPEVDADAENEAPAPTATTNQPPRVGEYWPGQGGIYAGIARGRDGEADYHLVLCKGAPERDFTWQAALDHAKTIESDGHKDFMVPTRWESALLYANLQDQFNTDYLHWTSTQFSESSAWDQFFNYGLQSLSSQAYERRCRFVRRSSVL